MAKMGMLSLMVNEKKTWIRTRNPGRDPGAPGKHPGVPGISKKAYPGEAYHSFIHSFIHSFTHTDASLLGLNLLQPDYGQKSQ